MLVDQNEIFSFAAKIYLVKQSTVCIDEMRLSHLIVNVQKRVLTAYFWHLKYLQCHAYNSIELIQPPFERVIL